MGGGGELGEMEGRKEGRQKRKEKSHMKNKPQDSVSPRAPRPRRFSVVQPLPDFSRLISQPKTSFPQLSGSSGLSRDCQCIKSHSEAPHSRVGSFPPNLVTTAHPGSGPGLGPPREPSQDAVLTDSVKLPPAAPRVTSCVPPTCVTPGKTLRCTFSASSLVQGVSCLERHYLQLISPFMGRCTLVQAIHWKYLVDFSKHQCPGFDPDQLDKNHGQIAFSSTEDCHIRYRMAN